MNKKRIIKWIAIAACLCALPFVIIIAHNLQVISREKDSSGVLKAALQLELTKASLVEVNGDPKELLTETHANKQVDVYLARRGWHRVDQMGAILYFGKGEQTMKISSRQISARYRLYELEQKP